MRNDKAKITEKKMEDRIITVPNVLSFIRILLVFAFVAAFFSKSEYNYIIAAVIFVISGATDVADGFIARRFNMISYFGKIIDPFADKLTQVTVSLCIAIKHRELIVLFAVYLIKELLMGIGGVIILKSGKKIASSKWFGKAATCVMFAVITIVVVFQSQLSSTALTALSSAAIFAVVFSLIMYIPEFINILNSKEEENNALQ